MLSFACHNHCKSHIKIVQIVPWCQFFEIVLEILCDIFILQRGLRISNLSCLSLCRPERMNGCLVLFADVLLCANPERLGPVAPAPALVATTTGRHSLVTKSACPASVLAHKLGHRAPVFSPC